jgi:hypothetical protein
MARFTPTHEPPDFPDQELPPEEPAPGGRQMLRMFIPVAAAIVVFIGALLLVIKLLVIPALERGNPAAQTRGVATLGALQTQQAITRTQQVLTPQPTPKPANTPLPVVTPQPASQPTAASAAAAVPLATQANQAPTTAVAAPAAVETRTSSVSTLVDVPSARTALPTTGAAPATQAPAAAAAPVQDEIDTNNVEAQTPAANAPVAVPTIDPVAQAEVMKAYSHYWEQRTLAFRDLDASLLDSVAAGPELDSLTGKIDQLRSEGRSIRTHVFHHFVALPTAPGEAVIADEYQDLSIYVDFETKVPLDPTNPDPQTGPIVKVRKLLQKLDGIWKVTGSQVYE